MTCKNCGKELQDGAKFCPECGTKNEETAVQQASEATGNYVVDANVIKWSSIEINAGQEKCVIDTDRSLFKYILFNIFTCGIYSLYFMYKLAVDVNIICDGDGKRTPELLELVLLSVITCGIYTWVWDYSIGNRLAENASRYGMQFSENGSTVLMWRIFGIFLCGTGPLIAKHIIINNTNALANAYNAR